MIISSIKGVPKFECIEYLPKNTKYCILIPIINEGLRIKHQLQQAQKLNIDKLCDIIICDGGSTDGSTDHELLKSIGVNSRLTKQDTGKQSAQLRMGFWWALERGYEGIITIDGNNKDSMSDIPKMIIKLDEGYDFIQGSRFIPGGKAINTPISRYLAVKYIHSPVISITAKRRYTDTTNAYRAHSRRYLTHPGVQPFRNIFQTYELLAYLSVRADQIGFKTCEIPVTRAYPKHEKTPTKINGVKGNFELISILIKNAKGKYNPNE